MTQPIRLIPKPEQIHLDVIAKLEHALALAKAGEITTVAVAAVYVDGSISSCWSQSDDLGRLLGSITALQFDVCRKTKE